MNEVLANSNDLYLRLLLSEWFYIASQTRKKQYEKADQEIKKMEKSLERKKPIRVNDSIAKKPFFPVLALLLFIVSIPAGAALAYYLGWVAFDDNVIVEKIFCCLIGAAVIGVALFFFASAVSKYSSDRKEYHSANAQNAQNKIDFERDTIAYQKASQEFEEKVPFIKEKRDALYKDYQLLDDAFRRSLSFIYPKYQNIVCVCQFTQYIESGRCTAFDGPYGCYNLFEEELRMNLIINKLDIIISRLDTLIENQREMTNVLKSIDSNVNSIKESARDIKMFSSIIALASVETANGISNVNQSVKDLNHTASEFDMYYRRYH